jgi:ABC-2 type transport system ATP-binding protein
MITINNLGKAYNNRIVVDIPQLTINEGEIFGLVGNNGAGKTTFFRLLLDLIRTDRGEAVSGDNIISKSELWKSYTGSYLDEGFLIDFLTPEEYFHFIAKAYSLTETDITNKLVLFKGLLGEEILDQKKKYIRDFSKGNRQKIGIVSALLAEPKVVILDEPFDGLDPTSQIVLKRILIDYNKRYKATILISSHDLNHITEICNRIALMEKGKIIRDIVNTETTLAELEQYFSPEKAW